MLQDSSPNFENTWKFLERRIADASMVSDAFNFLITLKQLFIYFKVHDVLVQSESATQHLSQCLVSAFITARNMLGLNFNRR